MNSIEILEQDEKMRLFVDWARENDIWVSENIWYPAKFGGKYLGVVSIGNIGNNECLVRVPNETILSVKSLEINEIWNIFEDHYDLFSGISHLYADYKEVIFLIYEYCKGASSKWYHFFNILPKNPEILSDWSYEELSDLHDKILIEETINSKLEEEKATKLLHDLLLNYPSQFPGITLDIIKWSQKIVNTRAFAHCGISLIPFADFFNHGVSHLSYSKENSEDIQNDDNSDDCDFDNDAGIDENAIYMNFTTLCNMKFGKQENFSKKIKTVFEESKLIDEKFYKLGSQEEDVLNDFGDYFVIKTGKNENHGNGSQLFISYGAYSNRMLLQQYGFAVLDNKYNYAYVKIPTTELIIENQIIDNFEIPCIDFKIKRKSLCLKLLRVLRAFAWDESLSYTAFLSPSDLNLELRIMHHALLILNKQLADFPTSIDEDYALLSQRTHERLEFSIIYRIEIKRCIFSQIKYFQILTEIISRMMQGELFECSARLVPGIENENDYKGNRKAIKTYLDCLRIFHTI
ncbi:unnamed protein product [Blepharisma stoltei]|uniref:SET domain-containing protein n=1 Tax=Blepharisma stoltei TaxID=1481888 RepID=A0AAU9KEN7_9CILI|nr:unnamed protein product [Blepharisma stoltei]